MGISLDGKVFFGAAINIEHPDQPWNTDAYIEKHQKDGHWSTDKTRSIQFFEDNDIHFTMHGYGEETQPAIVYQGTTSTGWGGELHEAPIDEMTNQAKNQEMRDKLMSIIEQYAITPPDHPPTWYFTALCW